jgi:transcriptional regulator with XRE-family HTH domain
MPPAKADYASAIRHVRIRAKLSQRKLASAVGVHPTHISHLEAGRRLPSIEVVEAIAFACWTTPAKLHARAYQ